MGLNPFKLVEPVLKYHVGGSGRPTYFDIDETYPELRLLDQNFSTILGDLNHALANSAYIPSYHEFDGTQKKISAEVDPELSWKVYVLKLFGKSPQQAQADCSATLALIDKIPGVLQAFFSILEPGKSIPPHEGPHCGWLRYHLGLQVPSDRPPEIIVNNISYHWSSGESVMFDDSWEHQVVNDATDNRIILVVDVIRPMARPFDWLNRLAVSCVGFVYRINVFRKLQSIRLQ